MSAAAKRSAADVRQLEADGYGVVQGGGVLRRADYPPVDRYRLVHVDGYSSLDHLAGEIIADANKDKPLETREAAEQSLRSAIARLRERMGPRIWPRIDVQARYELAR